ncbi:MAG: outer membrane lipoprotein carrier protein LolA [Rhizobiales bacterium]|nr:outer membrane lipoprotein carrier protein LolA [Hyphomicrobiales bacterium]
MLKFLKFTFLALLTAIAVSGSAPAANKINPITLNDAQRAAVVRVNDFINSFTTLRGDFTQTSDRGQSVKGVLMLSKPGKIRFDYAPPSPLLIVSDGRWLTIKNKVKERGDQVPLRSTPLRLIVAPKIDLLAETMVLSVEEADGFTSIALADKKDQLGGYIVLIYDNSQNTLQQWIIVDGKGRKTTVQFANLEKDVQLNQKLFMETIKRKDQVRN